MKQRVLQTMLLLVLFALPGISTAQVTLLDEPFTYGVAPVGWTQDSSGAAPFFTWTFNNPGNRSFKGSTDTTYAIFDSDHYAQGNSQDCYLQLPSLNSSSLSTVLLILKEAFRSYLNSYHQIEVSVDGGTTWSGLLGDTLSNVGGINLGTVVAPDTLVTNVYDITSIGAGQADLRIRFHYHGTWGWYWALDNVKVTDLYSCTSPPTPGRALAARAFSCNTDSFQLNLAAYSSGSGQTYQWKSSPDGLSWTNIAGATSNSCMVSQSGPTYYQCALTCSSATATSDSAYVGNQLSPGSALSTDAYTCDPSHQLTLSLSTTLPANGQLYQWESSPDGITWSPIPGAVADTALATQNQPTYYHCMVTCESNNISSDSVFVNTHPDAGNAQGSVFYVCNSTTNIDLTLSNNITVPGITFQWESSPDGTTWTPFVGATNDSLSVIQYAGTYYRCTVGCGLSSGPSGSVYIGTYYLASGCYCMPLNNVTCSGGDYISNVTIVGTSLNNNTTCGGTATNNYSFIPPTPSGTANLTRGTTYTMSVTTSSDNIISMWIDYNGDGAYDSTEWAQIATTTTAGTPSTVSFSVPVGAIVGEVGMRIRSRATANQNGPGDACLDMFSGETEDYIVGIETNVGLNTVLSDRSFLIAPNPSTGLVRITPGAAFTSNTTASVIDVLGNELQFVRNGNAAYIDLDLSSFAKGMYFIRLNNGKESVTRRLVISHE